MSDYGSLKVTDLRDMLKERGISSTGLTRKQQIIEALEAHDANATDEPEPAAEQVTADELAETDAPEPEAPQELEKEETNEPDPAAPEPRAPVPIPEDIHEPVSNTASTFATPQKTSPAPSDGTSESRKRKRRSPTPPLSEESVKKRMKSAEEEAGRELTDDAVLNDAPVPAPLESSMGITAPEASSDVPMDTSDANIPSQTLATSDAPVPHSDAMDKEEDSPSTHPATTALYIKNLIRPVNPSQLREHLESIAQSPNSSANDSSITAFHLDTLRTHALASFTSISAAQRARAALHNHIWPQEPSRRALWVDFIPDNKIQEWIDMELTSETANRRDAKRWEIIYASGPEGITATLQEIASGPPSGPPSTAHQTNASTAPAAGPGMPNAPLGPRSDREPGPPRHPVRAPEPAPQQQQVFNNLDTQFKSTMTKPKLYFLPQPPQLVERRLAELNEQTSQDWADVKISKLRGRDAQLVRYTFEDGDTIVDGGVDLGDFGRDGGGGGNGRGGRRRGGGGGFRGRR
ncbi:Hypothetical protein R9X50_00563600 [Acrodontium crateriforme]|uniref:SAP domain-containing protein n=1 Tax=Acrodontium crateriforme TaxID=150365 RepID=A0AAQ3M9Q5_9PEZI|nr:Hypothetical protein R9X50_00563600 [Acrodontium crateriforme]